MQSNGQAINNRCGVSLRYLPELKCTDKHVLKQWHGRQQGNSLNPKMWNITLKMYLNTIFCCFLKEIWFWNLAVATQWTAWLWNTDTVIPHSNLSELKCTSNNSSELKCTGYNLSELKCTNRTCTEAVYLPWLSKLTKKQKTSKRKPVLFMALVISESKHKLALKTVHSNMQISKTNTFFQHGHFSQNSWSKQHSSWPGQLVKTALLLARTSNQNSTHLGQNSWTKQHSSWPEQLIKTALILARTVSQNSTHLGQNSWTK